MNYTKDTWKIGNHEFTSRFILGSGKYSLDLIKAAVEQAGAQIITLALRRVNEGGAAEGPQQSGRVVIAAVDTSDVHCMETDHKAEVLLTSSSQRAAYYRSGWTSRAASIHMPWIRSCQELSAANETSIDRTLRYYVTGRFSLSFCQLTLEDSVEPHPRFKEAIDNALAAPELRRTEELAEVFRRFGHVYVASVEMGGMKHTTTTRAGFTKVCQISYAS